MDINTFYLCKQPKNGHLFGLMMLYSTTIGIVVVIVRTYVQKPWLPAETKFGPRLFAAIPGPEAIVGTPMSFLLSSFVKPCTVG